MTKIILNETAIPIRDYNRYTSITENGIESGANFSPVDSNVYETLIALSEDVITDIGIEIGGTEVYHLSNQNAKISSISENVYENNDRLSINVSLSFGIQEA